MSGRAVHKFKPVLVELCLASHGTKDLSTGVGMMREREELREEPTKASERARAGKREFVRGHRRRGRNAGARAVLGEDVGVAERSEELDGSAVTVVNLAIPRNGVAWREPQRAGARFANDDKEDLHEC